MDQVQKNTQDKFLEEVRVRAGRVYRAATHESEHAHLFCDYPEDNDNTGEHGDGSVLKSVALLAKNAEDLATRLAEARTERAALLTAVADECKYTNFLRAQIGRMMMAQSIYIVKSIAAEALKPRHTLEKSDTDADPVTVVIHHDSTEQISDLDALEQALEQIFSGAPDILKYIIAKKEAIRNKHNQDFPYYDSRTGAHYGYDSDGKIAYAQRPTLLDILADHDGD